MDATYRALKAADGLGEFTVAALAARAGIKETTARTVLNRHRQLFDRQAAGSGRRGGQPQIWVVKPTAREELTVMLGGIATRFDDNEGRLLPTSESAMDARPSALLRVPGPNPELLTAEDLERYAGNRAAQVLLPHLVRRLLVATPGVTTVTVRAGDAIGFTGYDGRAEAAVATPFVPEGLSVWEMGTGEDPRQKAQGDLCTRTRDPLDVDPPTTTFVTVAMRRFRDKEAWGATARSEGPWRDVRALDADDLVAWLEETPHVHVWASEQMLLRPMDVTSLSSWWTSWLAQTDPPIPEELPTAGRQIEARSLRAALEPDGQVVGVYAASREEALAFVGSALLLDDAPADYIASSSRSASAVVVHTREAWRRLVESRRPAVYIPLFDDPDLNAAVRHGHSVVVALGASDDRSRARVDLPAIGREEAREVFRRTIPQLDLEEADQRAAHARRSLVSFRRRYAISPAQRSPVWSQRPSADILAPLVLIGKWDGQCEADQGVIAALTGRAYEDIELELQRPSDPEDPAFVRAGKLWQLTAPTDAWALLSPCVTNAVLDRWHSLALTVLSEHDPTAELDSQDRFMASVRGVRREYSSALRSGVAHGAALVSSNAGTTNAPDGREWTKHADELVRALLGTGTDAQLWAWLEDVLQALAEASPDAFLAAAERGLRGSSPPLQALFRDRESDVWESRSPHTGLLWALELLCWSDEYVAEACEVLAQLADVDPGGRLANRPSSSLRRVVLPWFPQTSALLEQRIDIVRGLLVRRPSVGWQLVLGLLPQPFDSTHPTYKPTFRDWKSHAVEATVLDRLNATNRLVQLSLDHLERNADLWPQFIEVLPNLPPIDLQTCLRDLGRLDPESVSAAIRLATWQALVTILSRHRQFPDAQWALPESVLCEFDPVVARWEPQQLPERHARIFDWHPDLAGVDKFDHARYEEQLAAERQRVVTPLLHDHGVPGVARLAQQAPVPGFVGATLAEVAGDDVSDAMLSWFAEEGPLQAAARGWVIRMSDVGGMAWVVEAMEKVRTMPEGNRAGLYLSLPSTRLVWEAVDQDVPAVRDQYWQAIGSLGVNADDALELVLRFIDRRRPWSAIQLLAHHLHRADAAVSAELIEATLRAASGPDVDEPHPPGSLDYYLGLLLDALEARGGERETLVEFEWLFFAPLQYHRAPRALFRALAEQPELFVDLVKAAFRAAHEPAASEGMPAEIARARQAFMILREWRQPPGLTEDEHVDGRVLRDWITKARRLLTDADRLSVGEECIGEVLSGSPPGADGIWPAEAIRDLLEDDASESLEQGLAIGKFNARGVTSRGVFDGGAQENALADEYDRGARQVMARWPRTGRMLREMAASYRRWAR